MKQRVYYYENDNLHDRASTARYLYALVFVKGKVVADIGCGARQGPFILAEKAKKVFAVDISQEAVLFAGKHWPKNNIYYSVANATALAFNSDFFDIVVSFEVIEHIKDYKRYLTEISRILKKGGIVFISTPNRVITSADGVFSNPDHVREFDLKELKENLGVFFSSVTVLGQFPSSRVERLETEQKEQYSKVRRVPGFLKKIIPNKLKEFLLKKYINLMVRICSKIDKRQINEDDFRIIDKNVETARYFLAVCKK